MHKTASLAMLLALATLLGACGSSDDEASDDSDTNEEGGGEEGGGEEAEQAMAGRLSLTAPSDVAQAPADAEVTASGLASMPIEAGAGTRHPFPSDRVRVDYVGWTPDGDNFDASESGPVEFALTGVIDGWTEGVQLMVEGEVRRFWIPSELAYGDNPRRAGAPAGPLVFDVDLIAIVAP